ncbi:MAG: hypothetical protein R3Y08_07010 [Rikenellaceae bacterium]
MRKLITMLLFVATATFATSCDKAEEIISDIVADNTEMEYTGTIDVSAMGVSMYTAEDIQFILEKDGDVVSIMMDQVKFMESMPVTLDIKISDVPTSDGSFAIDSVIPTVGGIEMEDYAISDVSGEFDTKSLTMSFVCMNFDVDYNGTIE